MITAEGFESQGHTRQRVERDLNGRLIILELNLDVERHLHEGVDSDDPKVCAAQVQHKLRALLVKHFEHLRGCHPQNS